MEGGLGLDKNLGEAKIVYVVSCLGVGSGLNGWSGSFPFFFF